MLNLPSLKIKFIMKKITSLALIIFSAFLFSACGPKKDIDNITSVTPTSSTEQKSTFSLRELLSKNIAQKCTWQSSGEQGSGQGEIIISGNKFRQTLKVEGPEGETEFISISDGEWFYTWSTNSVTDNMAFKMKMDQTQNPTDTNTAQVNTGKIDLDQEFSYNCQPTTISETDFTLPKGINFIDFNDLTKQFQP